MVPQDMYLSVDDSRGRMRTAPDDEGELLLVGGNGHQVGRGGSTAARVADLDAWARRQLGVGDPLWSWAAQDYQTSRQVPSVGAVPGTGGALLVATGFDKWGMTNAAAAGHVLAGDLLGNPPAYASGLRSTGVSPRDVADAATAQHLRRGAVVRWTACAGSCRTPTTHLRPRGPGGSRAGRSAPPRCRPLTGAPAG